MMLRSDKKMTEREWAAIHSPRFQDDAQGYYWAQAQAILRGEVAMVLNDDHEAAYRAEMDAFLSQQQITDF